MIRRLHAAMKIAETRALVAFTAWFSSGGGVYQTFLVTMAIVTVELGDRNLDPHAFALMAVLTVYSAITQPALAYAGTVAAAKADEHAAALDSRLARIEAHLGIAETAA